MSASPTTMVSLPTPDAPLDRRDLRIMMGTAAYHASRVARTMALSETDREDVEQDILLALIERRRFFDPARGPWTPFAHRIARQAAQTIADRIAVTRRVEAISLDQPAVNMVAQSDDAPTRTATIETIVAPTEADILYLLSLIYFVGDLPHEFRVVAQAALIADGELADAQRTLGLSTSEFYRRLQEIRYRMFTVCLVDRRHLLDP